MRTPATRASFDRTHAASRVDSRPVFRTQDERDLTEMEFSLPALDEMASRSVFADGVLEIDGIEIDASLFASEADFDLDEDDDDENSDDSDVG